MKYSERFLPHCEVLIDTDLVKLIKYPYINGSHVPETCGHLAAMIEAVQDVWAQDVVHGDIRLSNVVFTTNENGEAEVSDEDWD